MEGRSFLRRKDREALREQWQLRPGKRMFGDVNEDQLVTFTFALEKRPMARAMMRRSGRGRGACRKKGNGLSTKFSSMIYDSRRSSAMFFARRYRAKRQSDSSAPEARFGRTHRCPGNSRTGRLKVELLENREAATSFLADFLGPGFWTSLVPLLSQLSQSDYAMIGEARKIGISRTSISVVENGRRSEPTALRLNDFANRSQEALFPKPTSRGAADNPETSDSALSQLEVFSPRLIDDVFAANHSPTSQHHHGLSENALLSNVPGGVAFSNSQHLNALESPRLQQTSNHYAQSDLSGANENRAPLAQLGHTHGKSPIPLALGTGSITAVSNGQLVTNFNTSTFIPATATGDICLSAASGGVVGGVGNVVPGIPWPVTTCKNQILFVKQRAIRSYAGAGVTGPKFAAGVPTSLSANMTLSVPYQGTDLTSIISTGKWGASSNFLGINSASLQSSAKVTQIGATSKPGLGVAVTEDPDFFTPAVSADFELQVIVSGINMSLGIDTSTFGNNYGADAVINVAGGFGVGTDPTTGSLLNWNYNQEIDLGKGQTDASFQLGSLTLVDQHFTLSAGTTYWLTTNVGTEAESFIIPASGGTD